MVKAEWGTKRICQSCGAKYYDLQRSTVVCPKCGAEYDPDALLRSRRVRPAAKAAEASAKVVAAKPAEPAKDEPEDDEELDETLPADDEVEDLIDDEDEDEDLIEDASELGGEDDMSDVVIEEEDKES